jgi:phosphatidylserine/phosphatidylglycerophosphate/cardiolipin synthase-like enzyme
LATGFTGALSLIYLVRVVYHRFHAPLHLAAHFSPHGGCTDVIVRELRGARREVQVLAYGFTSRPIAQALIDAKLRGVHVDVVLDHSNEHDPHSDLHFLLEQGLVVKIDPHHAIAHNKVMIVDGKTLLTGSFNFTHHAETANAENLVVIKGHPELVRSFRHDFHHHKDHARDPEVKVQPKPAGPEPAEEKAGASPAPEDEVFKSLRLPAGVGGGREAHARAA